MSKRRKKRSKEERIALLNLVIEEFEFDTKYGHAKSIDYYRSRVGIKVGNDLYIAVLTRVITPEKFLERVREYLDHAIVKKQNAIKAKEEISEMVHNIFELAKENKKYIECSMNTNVIFENDAYTPNPCGKHIQIDITFTV